MAALAASRGGDAGRVSGDDDRGEPGRVIAGGGGAQEGSSAVATNTARASAGPALAVYRTAKRTMVVASLSVGIVAALVVATRSRPLAVAVLVGVGCGILNAIVSMRANERLVDHRLVAPFVLSSVLRVFVFGIVPVGLSAFGPWWSLAAYFAGFFTPLALFAASVARAPRSNER